MRLDVAFLFASAACTITAIIWVLVSPETLARVIGV